MEILFVVDVKENAQLHLFRQFLSDANVLTCVHISLYQA